MPAFVSVQVHLVSRGHVQIVGGICDAKGLIPDHVPVLQLGDWLFIPILPTAIDPRHERFRSLRVGLAIVRRVIQAILPRSPCVLP